MRSAGISTALNSYGAIMTALEEVSNESGKDDSRTKARGLLEQFQSCRMYWSLSVANRIFGPAERLSKSLQAIKMTVNGALAAVKMTHDLLTSLRDDKIFDDIMQDIAAAEEKYGLEALVLPRTRKPPKRLDNGSAPAELTVKQFYKQMFFQLLDKVTSCLQDRFIDNADLHLYAELESILIGTTSITDKCLEKFAAEININILKTELHMLQVSKSNGSIPQLTSLFDLQEALLSKPVEVRNLFVETLKLANILICIPATSATAERSFSCLRRLKTWINSTMTQERLNSIAILHMYHQVQLDLDTVLNEFIDLNEVRKRTFGPAVTKH
jgi:hypothetical protein